MADRCVAQLFTGCALLLAGASFGGVTLSGDNAVALPGASATIQVTLAADVPVSAIQFDVAVDTRILTAQDATAAAGLSDHVIRAHSVASNRMRYVIYSPTSAAITPGAILSLPFDVRTTAYGTSSVALSGTLSSNAAGVPVNLDGEHAGSVVVDFDDTDGDGLADGLERRVINHFNADRFEGLPDVTPTGDFDRDGWTNKQEEPDSTADPVSIGAFPEFQMVINADAGARAATPITLGYAFGASDGFDNGIDAEAVPEDPIFIKGPAGASELAGDVRGAALTFEWLLCARDSLAGPVTLSWDTAVIPSNHSVTLAKVEVAREAADIPATRIDMKITDTLVLQPGDCYRMMFARGLVNFDFVRGWNLISLPIDPDHPGRDAIFADLQNVVFELGSRKTSGPPRLLIPDSVSAKKGIWVHFDQPTTLGIPGIAPEENTLTLTKGWNLVGFVEQTQKPADANLRRNAFLWDQGRRRFTRVQDGDDVVPGRAYYFFAKQDTEIEP